MLSRSTLKVLAALVLSLILCGCSQGPEKMIAARWVESSWSFEKVAESPPNSRRFEGVRVQAFEGREFLRHEAEYWRFNPDRSFEIRLQHGERYRGHWLFRGRGHILVLRYQNGEEETFEVKELNGQELILHVHLGMEVRGIARLAFVRDESSARDARARNVDSGNKERVTL